MEISLWGGVVGSVTRANWTLYVSLSWVSFPSCERIYCPYVSDRNHKSLLFSSPFSQQPLPPRSQNPPKYPSLLSVAHEFRVAEVPLNSLVIYTYLSIWQEVICIVLYCSAVYCIVLYSLSFWLVRYKVSVCCTPHPPLMSKSITYLVTVPSN